MRSMISGKRMTHFASLSSFSCETSMGVVSAASRICAAVMLARRAIDLCVCVCVCVNVWCVCVWCVWGEGECVHVVYACVCVRVMYVCVRVCTQYVRVCTKIICVHYCMCWVDRLWIHANIFLQVVLSELLRDVIMFILVI